LDNIRNSQGQKPRDRSLPLKWSRRPAYSGARPAISTNFHPDLKSKAYDHAQLSVQKGKATNGRQVKISYQQSQEENCWKKLRPESGYPAPQIPFSSRERSSSARTGIHIYPRPAEPAEAVCEPEPPAGSGDKIKSWLQTARKPAVFEVHWNGDGELVSGDSSGTHYI